MYIWAGFNFAQQELIGFLSFVIACCYVSERLSHPRADKHVTREEKRCHPLSRNI